MGNETPSLKYDSNEEVICNIIDDTEYKEVNK